MITPESQKARDLIRQPDPTCGKGHPLNIPCAVCNALSQQQAILRRGWTEDVYRLEREAEIAAGEATHII